VHGGLRVDAEYEKQVAVGLIATRRPADGYYRLQKRLFGLGKHTVLLPGDAAVGSVKVRKGITYTVTGEVEAPVGTG